MRTSVLAIALLPIVGGHGLAASRVETNVVYGMYSGSALLMDVHHPDHPNGYGLVLIPGSGWQTSQGYDSPSIKNGASALFVSVPPLLEAGYTLFVINHRTAPRFRYPGAFEDVQRAVRFVRFHAIDYHVTPGTVSACHLARCPR